MTDTRYNALSRLLAAERRAGDALEALCSAKRLHEAAVTLVKVRKLAYEQARVADLGTSIEAGR